jgi:DNA polymerase phi
VHSVWHLLLDTQESAKKKRAKSGSSKDAKDIKKIEENLANFWSIAVDGALLSSSHERKNLAMELLLLVLPKLPSLESVGIVLSNIFVRCILDILSSKDSHLHKSAQRCLSELRLWAESSNLRRAAVIAGLQKNSYGKFDTLSKTSTVKALTNGLTTEDGVLAFVHNLEELFVAPESAVVTVPEELVEGSEDAVMNGNDKPGANDRIWIVEQMCALCRQVKLEPKTAQASLYRAVIKFLITHSLFEASKQQNSGVAEKKGFRWPQKLLAVNIRKLCAERLHSILVDAEQFMFSQKSKSNKAGASGVSEAVTDDEDFSLFAALYCLSVQKSPDAGLVQPLKEEGAESVKILQRTVATLSTAVSRTSYILLRMAALLFFKPVLLMFFTFE